jgi:hypothetical protein
MIADFSAERAIKLAIVEEGNKALGMRTDNHTGIKRGERMRRART